MEFRSKFLRTLGWTVFFALIIHLIVEVSGHHYLYPTISKTIFRGMLGPGIEEYKLNDNDTIRAGTPQPWDFSADYNTAELSSDDIAYHEQNESVSFLVIHQDSIVYERYWEHFDETTPSNSFSMAKSIVALLIGIAIDRGEIKSVDQPVYWYLPQYETEFGKLMTIEDLLTMSSGINFDEHYLNPFAFPARANYGDNLEMLLRNYQCTSTPGEVWSYQSGNTQVLGLVLQAATRKSLPEYASEHVWKKIGSEVDAPWSLDRKGGMVRAFCCINAPARDFARIGKLYLNHGRWNDHQVVDSAYVSRSVQPAELINAEGEPNKIYGYQWWIGEENGMDFFFMRGIKGQYVFVIPEEDLIIVRMGRKRVVGEGREHPEDVYRYLHMGLNIVKG